MNDVGVLVVGESEDSRLEQVSREALAAGELLARGLQKELSLLLMGQALEGPAQDAIAFGARQVYLVQHSLLADPTPEIWVEAAAQACRRLAPQIVLMGRTVAGRELAPRLAFRLGVGLLQDCIQLRLEKRTKRLVGIRPVYGGNAMAAATCAGSPQMATVRPRAYKPPERASDRSGEVVPLEVHLTPDMVRTRLVERRREADEGIPLETARVVVAGGRGMGGREGFAKLEEMARLLGGAVGATRVPVDMGWTSPSSQIGLTGKTVSPELYIAVGLSGASQHMSGVSGAGATVVINTDGEARIFDSATYGVVGDWREVLPAFIETLRELRQTGRP